ncbi:MAG: hypothetical protein V4732_19875 [Pseudomonadota bacterium]
MKINTTATILISAMLITATTNSSVASPQNCETYQHKINRLQTLNARGGKAKQLQFRRQQINQYEAELYKCSNVQKIQILSNHNKNKAKTNRGKLRPNKTQNPQLQQLIKTCNYWINQNNQYPSWDNGNFRDTACRAADEKEDAINNPAAQIGPNVRTLNDCIKPNNVIDDDVNECMKGIKEASWKN